VISTHIKTDDPSNRFLVLKAKKIQAMPTYSLPTVNEKSNLPLRHTLSAFSVKDLQTILANIFN